MRKKYITSGNDDYVIVLGKRLDDDGKPLPELYERLGKAIELYRNGVVDKFLVCGGRTNELTEKKESEVMKEYLVSRGVKADLIVEEGDSKTTLSNGRFCKKILKSIPHGRLYLITSSYHTFRPYLNPRRIFRFMYGLPVRCVHSVDGNVEIYGKSVGKPVLFIYKDRAELDGFLRNNPDARVIAKDVNTAIRNGRKKHFIRSEESAKEFVAEIEKVFGNTEVIFSEER